jgi:hypothetical protein
MPEISATLPLEEIYDGWISGRPRLVAERASPTPGGRAHTPGKTRWEFPLPGCFDSHKTYYGIFFLCSRSDPFGGWLWETWWTRVAQAAAPSNSRRSPS